MRWSEVMGRPDFPRRSGRRLPARLLRLFCQSTHGRICRRNRSRGLRLSPARHRLLLLKVPALRWCWMRPTAGTMREQDWWPQTAARIRKRLHAGAERPFTFFAVGTRHRCCDHARVGHQPRRAAARGDRQPFRRAGVHRVARHHERLRRAPFPLLPGAAAAHNAFVPWKTAQAALLPRSIALAGTLNSALLHAGVKVTIGRTTLTTIDSMTCPAVAIEVAPRQLVRSSAPSGGIDDPSYQAQVAEAIAAGLLEWRGEGQNP